MNEQYPMPAMPEGAREGILKGMYRFKPAARRTRSCKAQIFGSGAILNEVVKAQEILAEVRRGRRRVERDQLQELYREAHACERWNMLHPGEAARECRT